MSQLNVLIDTDLNADTLERDYQRPLSAKYPDVQAIGDLIEAILSGNQPGTPPSLTVDNYGNAVKATGSLRLSSAIAGNTFTINGVTFTGVGSNATNNQFNIGLNDTATAVNIAAAVNSSTTPLISGTTVSTGSSGVVVSLASKFFGQVGNMTTLGSGQGTIVVSAARLTGGSNDPNQKVYTF